MNVRSVVALALALTVPAAEASDRPPFDAAQLPASARPHLEAAALVANVENSFRMVVPTDERSGVSQILDLVGRTDFEEQWVFVPAINLWIEIGTNESASELDSQVEIDTDYLGQIVGRYHAVEIVHFHPAGYYRRVWQNASYPIEFPADALESGDLQPVGFALPSPKDIVSSIELSRMLLGARPGSQYHLFGGEPAWGGELRPDRSRHPQHHLRLGQSARYARPIHRHQNCHQKNAVQHRFDDRHTAQPRRSAM